MKLKKRQFGELKKDIHKNACEHGWHDKEKPVFETMVLILAEVSEALEDYRDGKKINEVWYESGKPCGIPTELADVCIRLWDYQGSIGFNDKTAHPYKSYLPRTYWNKIDAGFTSALAITSVEIVDVFNNLDRAVDVFNNLDRSPDEATFSIITNSLIDTIVFHIAQKYKIDMWKVILEKHEYNKSRPYRHGSKVC